MKIKIKVKAGAKEESVAPGPDGTFTVKVKAKPEKGKANEAVLKLLSRHFNVPQNAVSILRGRTSPRKLVEIEGLA